MPTLTLEAIRQNPWNVLTHDLPSDPSHLLLRVARLAASYCREAEYMLVLAIRAGDYVPAGWTGGENDSDAHEASEGRCYEADDKLTEIDALFGENEPAG
jgi:predicted transcriptional regulator